MLTDQRTPIGADAGGDSAPERVAAFRRRLAECELSVKAQIAHHEGQRDRSDRALEAIRKAIAGLVGPDRDDADGLDEEKAGRYKRLAGAEREQATINAVARELIDRLRLTDDGEDEEDDGKPGKD